MANTKVIVIPEGKICDYIDGKFRNDTPEEYVRQTIEKDLLIPLCLCLKILRFSMDKEVIYAT